MRWDGSHKVKEEPHGSTSIGRDIADAISAMSGTAGEGLHVNG